jgi:branched-chain amino acid transport system ATP-binding protein
MISVAYSGIPVLENVSLQVQAGEIVLIVGSNGAGKTTLLNAVSGMVAPTRGCISAFGKRLNKLTPEEIVRMGIIQCPAGRRLFASLSVEENLRIASLSRRLPKDIYDREQAELETIFPLLRLRRQELAGNLSGGEQQIVALARAILAQPQVLLLDEPCTGLAETIVTAVPSLIKRLAERGCAVLWVDERPDRIIGVADRLFSLQHRHLSV